MKLKMLSIRKWLWVTVYLLFPISQILIFYGVQSTTDGQTFWWNNKELLICFIGMIAADIAFVFAIVQQVRQWNLNKKLDEEKLIYEMRQRANEDMERQQVELRKMKEGFQRQILQLLEDVEKNPEQAKAGLEEFQKQLNGTRIVHYCENDIINAVISKYTRVCAGKDIAFDVRLELDAVRGIEPVHLCSVFSNLLDNAVHACDVLENEKRWICVGAGMKGDYIRIVVENTAKEEKKKKDLTGHYGMKILQDIANTYDGSYESGYQDGMYTAALILLQKMEKAGME